MTYWRIGKYVFIVGPNRTYIGLHWTETKALVIPEGFTWYTSEDPFATKMTRLECRLRGLL